MNTASNMVQPTITNIYQHIARIVKFGRVDGELHMHTYSQRFRMSEQSELMVVAGQGWPGQAIDGYGKTHEYS